MDFNIDFLCEFCGRHSVTTTSNYYNRDIVLEMNNKYSENFFYLNIDVISCPNPNCQEIAISNTIYPADFNSLGQAIKGGKFSEFFEVRGKKQISYAPEYIPEAIRHDFHESQTILELSPKAAATLARRCMQGMIRDFWGVTGKHNLHQEIQAIEDRVDPATHEAIDAVRAIGNIGAHMEKDINVIIDVTSEEAHALVELINMLINDWYVQRHERAKRLGKIKAMREAKKP